MTWIPQSVLPRRPSVTASDVCVTVSLAKSTHQSNRDWEGGRFDRNHPPPPSPAPSAPASRPIPAPGVEQTTGKGEEVEEKEMGRERGAVNKELPLCEVLRWVQSRPLPEGPRFVHHPTPEPSGSETGRGRRSSLRTSTSAPVPICPANYLLRQPGRCPLQMRRGRAGALSFRAQAVSPGRLGRRRLTVAAGSLGTRARATSGQGGDRPGPYAGQGFFPQETPVCFLNPKALSIRAHRSPSYRQVGESKQARPRSTLGRGRLGPGGPARPSAQLARLISMRLPSPLPSPGAAARIPRPSPRARTLISLQMEAGGAGCNKRQKLRSGASMRAFSPATRGWIQLPAAV